MHWLIITLLSFIALIVFIPIADKLDMLKEEGVIGIKSDILFILIFVLVFGMCAFSLIAPLNNSEPCGDVYYSISKDKDVVVKITEVAKDGDDYIVSFYDDTINAIHTEWGHSFYVKMTKDEYNKKIESGVTSIVTTRYNINYLSKSEYMGIKCFPRGYSDFKYEFMDGVVDESDVSIRTFHKGLEENIGTLRIRFNFDRYVEKNDYIKMK